MQSYPILALSLFHRYLSLFQERMRKGLNKKNREFSILFPITKPTRKADYLLFHNVNQQTTDYKTGRSTTYQYKTRIVNSSE